MKRSIVVKTSGIYCIIFSCFFIFIAACNTGLKKSKSDNKQQPNNSKQTESDDQTFVPDELIIWKNPNKKPEEHDRWLDSFKKKYKGVAEKNLCGSCDNSLILLKGPGVKTFISGDLATAKITSNIKPPSTGDDDTVYYSLNYRVRFKKPNITHINTINKLTPEVDKGEPVRVAVFDTGVDPDIFSNYLYKAKGRSCIKGAASGYNFIEQSADFSDDDPKQHGSIVTHFIIEQVRKYKGNKVEILPVKTHDANEGGDLYGILCAFAYAQSMDVQIINASFGFYAPRRKLAGEADPAAYSNALLLRKYIYHYLTKNNILLVCAAGNEDDENEKKAFDDFGLQDYYPKEHRSLDKVAFLPASYARSPELQNVITVTTVHVNNNGKGDVSPNQNFSANVVDIGVNADALTDDKNYGFQTPLLQDTEVAVGSSFAAPIVTGMICANYDRIKAVIKKKNFKKEDIWKELGPHLVSKEQTLKDKIREGRVMKR